MRRLNCGRPDDHPDHEWDTPDSRPRGVRYWCPGPPVTEGAA